MTQVVWRKNSEGKETNEQAAVRGVDLTQHGGEGIECRLVRTWQLMDAGGGREKTMTLLAWIRNKRGGLVLGGKKMRSFEVDIFIYTAYIQQLVRGDDGPRIQIKNYMQ